MKQWTLRLGLSLTIAVGLWANPAVAQVGIPAPTPVPAPYEPAPHLLLVPVIPYEPAHQPPYPLPFVPPPPPILSDRPCQRCLNAHGMACQPNFYGTGNFHSEAAFIFSSSRNFFGEPCFPNPPHGYHKWRR